MLLGFREGCGLTMPYKVTGANPAQVIASHEPAIEPCRHIGNDVLFYARQAIICVAFWIFNSLIVQ